MSSSERMMRPTSLARAASTLTLLSMSSLGAIADRGIDRGMEEGRREAEGLDTMGGKGEGRRGN